MPSLDDIPTLPTATLSADDQFAVIDGADRRSPRRATLAALKTFTLSGNLGAIQVSSVQAATANILTALNLGSSFTFSAPTVDPQVNGRVWADPADGFRLKVSQGIPA
jgi:hypothetical protein